MSKGQDPADPGDGQFDRIINESLGKILKCDPQVIAAIPADQNLTKFAMTSMNYMKLVMELEDRLQIEFENDELLIENFQTIAGLRKLIIKIKAKQFKE